MGISHTVEASTRVRGVREDLLRRVFLANGDKLKLPRRGAPFGSYS